MVQDYYSFEMMNDGKEHVVVILLEV